MMTIRLMNLLFLFFTYSCIEASTKTTKLEDVAKIAQANVGVHNPNTLLDDNEHTPSTTGERHKRYYNHYGYPSFNSAPNPPFPQPFNYPREYPANPQLGSEDPYFKIYRQLQDIADYTRQQNYAPQIPVILPIVYLPQNGCNCQGTNINGVNNSNPGLNTRFPEMDDPRQNWGFTVNRTQNFNDPNDGSRPLSFEPIAPITTANRPAPPVNHGSAQSGSNDMPTTYRPTQPNQLTPDPCDAAVVSCCAISDITYDCFTNRGCLNPSFSSNPCKPESVLEAIDRLRKLYVQRNG